MLKELEEFFAQVNYTNNKDEIVQIMQSQEGRTVINRVLRDCESFRNFDTIKVLIP